MDGVRYVDQGAVFDVVVIGAGPAGLSCALGLTTEGRSVCVIDSHHQCGGQAREALRIVNLFGVLGGVRGHELVANARQQVKSYGGAIRENLAAESVSQEAGRFRVLCQGGDSLLARAVVLATGTRWNSLPVFEPFTVEAGVHYGSPHGERRYDHQSVLVVGGGNSAAQAALHVAEQDAHRVHLVMRCAITARMSDYLIREIGRQGQIVVHQRTQVTEVYGVGRVQEVVIGSSLSVPVSEVYILAGGLPNTECVRHLIAHDAHGYVLTDGQFGTSVPGVFAVGDVRRGAIRRVSVAVGEGSAAVPAVHAWLDLLESVGAY